MNSELSSAYRFMRDQAGYVVGQRAKGALELARAERLLAAAVELELVYVHWEWDDEPYDPGDSCTDDEAQARFDSNEWTGPFDCIIESVSDEAGDAYASLWGIVVGPRGTNDRYCRVVEAELASELVDELRQAIGDYLDRHLFVYAATYADAMDETEANHRAALAIGRA